MSFSPPSFRFRREEQTWCLSKATLDNNTTDCLVSFRVIWSPRSISSESFVVSASNPNLGRRRCGPADVSGLSL